MLHLSLPEKIFDPLFRDISMAGILADGKTLSDAIPLKAAEDILRDYEAEKNLVGFDLLQFFNDNFKTGGLETKDFYSDTSQPLFTHIHRLWPLLTREKDNAIEGSSLIPLPYPYVVPGGRFNEIYYWDSYFTMLGLEAEDNIGMIKNMTDNFAWLIRNAGFIPNGNRSYFLSRSQPPFFSMMVSLLAKHEGSEILTRYYQELLTEYSFWMESSESTAGTYGHRVSLTDGILNRYWDRLDTPRSEMYADDIHLSNGSARPAGELYRNVRCACESGWDFSSRWFGDEKTLDTIQTAHILPVDLNCLLYHLETTIAKAAVAAGEPQMHSLFLTKADERKTLIEKYFWDEQNGYYFDFDHVNGVRTGSVHAAGVFPLFLNISAPDRAKRCLAFLEKHLLKMYGVVTTTISSGQQWDAPNGWAPLQWVAFKSALNYGYDDLAARISDRWTGLNEKIFRATGKMMEKYNVVDADAPGGGGEYPVQDGFGWTNGVYLAMKNFSGKT